MKPVKSGPIVDNLPYVSTMAIKIKAQEIKQTGDNEWDIYIPIQHLPSEITAQLEKLFPNTWLHIEKALQIETLISALKD